MTPGKTGHILSAAWSMHTTLRTCGMKCISFRYEYSAAKSFAWSHSYYTSSLEV